MKSCASFSIASPCRMIPTLTIPAKDSPPSSNFFHALKTCPLRRRRPPAIPPSAGLVSERERVVARNRHGSSLLRPSGGQRARRYLCDSACHQNESLPQP